MFPYRQRAPVYGGKLKQRKKEEQAQEGNNQVDPLAAGGPVQCAIRLDLLEQRRTFSAKIQSIDDPIHGEASLPSHVARGQVFSSFKDVFGGNKIALLHTRVTPPRCDRDMYSQLIYATCLSLLREAFHNAEDARLNLASYALFCLYALYETNPLPSGPEDERSILEMLPLGLQSAENAKFLRRRSFKTPIRVDRDHYILLMRLRDEALAAQANCQLRRMEAREQQLCDSLNGEKLKSGDYSCSCGVATDVLHLLDMLFTGDYLDMTEYTGPCGLEGLAGHEDYPYSSCRPKKKQKQKGRAATVMQTARMTDEELDSLGTGSATTSTVDEFSALQGTYVSHLHSIHAIVVEGTILQKERQIRNALEPLWQQQSTHSTSACETSMMPPPPQRSMRRPAVSLAASTTRDSTSLQAESEGVSGGLIRRENAEQNKIATDISIPFHTTLPNGLHTTTQNAIMNALRFLMAREGDSVKANVAATGHVEVLKPPSVVDPALHGAPGAPEPSLSVHSGGDGWSSVGFDGASVQSAATGYGASALRSLLLTARKGSSGSRCLPYSVPATASLPQTTPATTAASARNQFLTLDPHFSVVDRSDEESLSEISELSSDDEVSVAASAIGQTALRTLLATVNDRNGSKVASKRKGKRRNATTKQSPSVATKPKTPKNEKRPPNKRKRRSPLQDPEGGSSASKSLMSDEGSFVSIRGSGRAALDALLSRVANAEGPSDTNNDEGSFGAPGSGKAALDALFSRVADSVVPVEGSDEENN